MRGDGWHARWRAAGKVVESMQGGGKHARRGSVPHMDLARSATTMDFSFGKVRMVEAMARLPAPMATRERRPKRS